MKGMAARRVSMMGCFLVLPTVVMFGRFPMVAGGVRMMFGCLPVVFSCFLRHGSSSKDWRFSGMPADRPLTLGRNSWE